ncbi:uncharacterized protein LOC122400517 [Colletes gigas]|uniref:uncharacterized protein LOC122400517 n=1 Tax=Colletes gigas TaxID=935657 RepID=UPI001C9B9428|nr:uncharacterized protein LOC122400517 [Colletes gigas]
MDPALKNLILERGKIRATLTRFKNYVDSYDRTSSPAALRVRLGKTTPIFESFDSVQQKIESTVEGTEAERTHETIRDEFELDYCETVGLAEDIISQWQKPELPRVGPATGMASNTSQSNFEIQSKVKPPTIELPTFDGTYSLWIKFRDTFESLIHTNSTLNNIEKFHYLNSAIKGDAARVIETLGISDMNYLFAWDALKSRFENKKALKHNQVRTLWDLPTVAKESCTGLRRLLDGVNNSLLALKALGERTEFWDTIIIYLVSTKLDSATKREWERHQSRITGDVTLRDMNGFLEEHCRYLEKVQFEKPQVTLKPQYQPVAGTNRPRVTQVVAHATTSHSCLLCKKQHAVAQCAEFKRLTPSARISRVQQLRACFNCLAIGHRNMDCTRDPCKLCGKRHHTLLHLDQTAKQSNTVIEQPEQTSANTALNSMSCVTQAESVSEAVILSTVVVYIKDHKGLKHECRALLDSGSQSHFITEAMITKLGLPCKDSNTRVTGIGGSNHGVHRKAWIEIKSMYNGFKRSISCLILPRITGHLPGTALDNGRIQVPSNFKLADPRLNEPREVQMIIGAGLFWDIQCIGRHSLGRNQPILQKTQLGWVLAGRIGFPDTATNSQVNCNLVTNEQLHEELQRFWEIEDSASEPSRQIPKDLCERHFLENTERGKDGRFVVGIPFKDTLIELGTSYEQTHRRLLSLERRLRRQPELKQRYIKFMKEYQELGHMTEIARLDKQDSIPGYFLPHHAVLKETSTTTKLRVVFDGSCKSTSRLSVNDVQIMVGPTVQDDLLSILLRFRKHKYVLSADIEKMYRQIRIRTEDRQYQRILWRTNESEEIRVFELNTVTYGTASAPFLATRALRQLGEIHREEFPAARLTIIEDFYVDDLLTGTDSWT